MPALLASGSCAPEEATSTSGITRRDSVLGGGITPNSEVLPRLGDSRNVTGEAPSCLRAAPRGRWWPACQTSSITSYSHLDNEQEHHPHLHSSQVLVTCESRGLRELSIACTLILSGFVRTGRGCGRVTWYCRALTAKMNSSCGAKALLY